MFCNAMNVSRLLLSCLLVSLLILVGLTKSEYVVHDADKFKVLSPKKNYVNYPVFFAIQDFKPGTTFKWNFEKVSKGHVDHGVSCKDISVYSRQDYMSDRLVLGDTWQPKWSMWSNYTDRKLLCSDTCIVWFGSESTCYGRTIAKSFLQAGTYEILITATLEDTSSQFKFNVEVEEEAKLKHVAIRQEVRQLSQREFKEFVNSLYKLKELFIYDLLVASHRASMQLIYSSEYPEINVAHGSASFLPWHRMYLQVTEMAMQTFSNNSSIGIPYWNWTIDADIDRGPIASEIWSAEYFGGKGNLFDQVVEDGPFCGRKSSKCEGRWPIRSFLDGPYLKRNVGYLFQRAPNAKDINATMSRSFYDSLPFTNRSNGFRSAIEGWVEVGHNAVHSFVGGHMASTFSVNDPIFLVHHSMIDRLWTEYNKSSPKPFYPDENTRDLWKSPLSSKIGKEATTIIGQMADHYLWPFTKTIRQVLSKSNQHDKA
ncbi:hypothetical protein MP638_000152 [Amoeboaphelidium occidentale]|nr:hypothetical protein MP638_000152 [Amoeboaphelidium occidentale]